MSYAAKVQESIEDAMAALQDAGIVPDAESQHPYSRPEGMSDVGVIRSRTVANLLAVALDYITEVRELPKALADEMSAAVAGGTGVG